MNVVIDNLLASIIGCTVGLILFASQQHFSEHNIERIRYYAARRGQAMFLQTLERDLHNMVKLKSLKKGTTDSTFTFTAYLDAANTTIGTIAYRQRRVGTAAGTPIYRVTRTVTKGGTTKQEGGSLDAITGWNIEAWTAADDNDPAVYASSVDNAKRVYVWFASVSPLINRSKEQTLSTISTINWEASYWAPALRDSTDL